MAKPRDARDDSRSQQDTTSAAFLRVYDELVGREALSAETARLREDFMKRTGAFGPDDPSAEVFEARSRAFWDDALTHPGFAEVARAHLGDELDRALARLSRAHRGLFVVEPESEGDLGLIRLRDLWSGAELLVTPLDESEALALAHAEGPMDARVAAADDEGRLAVLPGMLHHPAAAAEPILGVLSAAREKGMKTREVLDALLRMEMVFRRSSRVKIVFAYRPEALSRA